ncbi:MAG: tRNA-dihydrouridine synthase family protein [Clostridia bacterium]|nr:tRNA-dihydrouridine synthase family protein [Clostridia bacterium]
MKLYFAPLEGITTYTYRNAHSEMFGECDKYFSPFITPTANEKISLKSLRDILPEKNKTNLVVQALCNDTEAFWGFSEKVKDLGYNEINLNFGCPSGTVVKKMRGAGALRDIDSLDRFLDGIFLKTDMTISVKTRTGFYSHDEFDEILSIYNKYPISELIVHPRTREEYYNNLPNEESFGKAYSGAKTKLSFNGNVYSAKDYERIIQKYDRLDSVMIGRGAIKNPAIFREIRGGKPLATKELVDFSNLLEERYLKVLGSEIYTLHKLKEIWMYMVQNFPEEKKILKAVKKANRLCDLNSAIGCLSEL